ncbi:hypothetical protein JCM6882_005752 [Rhodosporidiobolus microsporus]
MTDTTLSDSPQATDQPPPRLTASFASLPPELKAAIAREVKLADDARRADRAARNRRPSRRRDALVNLGLVSREMSEVVRPIQWEHVDFNPHSFAALYLFVGQTLVRVRHLVRSLAWSHHPILVASGKGTYRYDEVTGEPLPEKLDRMEKPLIKAVERLGALEPNQDAHYRRLRAIEFLVAVVVKQCTNLSTVDYSNLHQFEQFLENRSFPPWDNMAEYALLLRADQLESVKLFIWYDTQDNDVQPILERCRNLRRLELTDMSITDVDTTAPSYKAFLRRLFGMPDLESLKLFIPLPPSDQNIPVSAPLLHLSLRGSGLSAFRSFEPFILAASSTLRTLELLPPPEHAYPAEKFAGAVPTSPLPLPHLKRLVFSASFPSSVLARFSLSPLVAVGLEDPEEIDARGRGTLFGALDADSDGEEDKTSPKGEPAVLAFLSSHSSTLKHVDVSVQEDLLFGGWGTVRPAEKRFCAERGVAYGERGRPVTDDYMIAAYGDCCEGEGG